GLNQVARRCQQFQADEQGEESSDEKEEGDGDEVKERNAFMVGRQQPRADAVLLIQIVDPFGLRVLDRHTHCTWLPLETALPGAFTGTATAGLDAAPDLPDGDSDFTYATSALTCSSLTSPWNVGMMGRNPLTRFAPGSRMHSRR